MTSIGLGMPALPPPVLAPRRQTRQIQVGKVGVGSDHPISVQSMTTTLTADVNATLQQIAELTAAGCDIVRVACPSQDDAEALPAIAQKSQIPVIADIHFQPKYVFAAIEAGCAAVRVNPGNIKRFDDQVKEIAQAAKDHGTSIRIGVNAGSLDKRLLEKYGKATPEALVESAVWEASLFEEHDFHDFKISVKHNDPVVMVRAYELLAEAGDWPLHLGVTEAGPAFQGTIKSAVAFGALLSEGIGDTIRVSLSAPPVEEAFDTADGVRLKGLFHRSPGGHKQGDAVVVLLYPPGPDRDMRKGNWDDLIGRLNDAGFHVFRFDWRGHGGSAEIADPVGDNTRLAGFWTNAITGGWNRRHVRGYSRRPVKNDLRVKPDIDLARYLPVFVTDLAAARLHLDQKNDQGEVNTSSIYLVGAGDTAALGRSLFDQLIATPMQGAKRFTPEMPPALREQKYSGWKEAVRKLLG